MVWVHIARADVKALATGYWGPGGLQLTKQSSFPWSEAAQRAVAVIAGDMYASIDARHPLLLTQPEQRAAVLAKLVTYLSRTGAVEPPRIRNVADEAIMAARALAEQPTLILEPVGFASLVVRYRQFLAEDKRARRLRRPGAPPRPIDTPERPILWVSPGGLHELRELVHPWHLVEETDALGHCLGRHSNNYWPGRDDDLFTLPYWRLVEAGTIRLFSLSTKRGPLCTIQVEQREPSPSWCPTPSWYGPTISHIEGRSRERLANRPYYPALIQAIGYLHTLFPGLSITSKGQLALLNHYFSQPHALDVARRALP
jgi:hypothetical protein